MERQREMSWPHLTHLLRRLREERRAVTRTTDHITSRQIIRGSCREESLRCSAGARNSQEVHGNLGEVSLEVRGTVLNEMHQNIEFILIILVLVTCLIQKSMGSPKWRSDFSGMFSLASLEASAAALTASTCILADLSYDARSLVNEAPKFILYKVC